MPNSRKQRLLAASVSHERELRARRLPVTFSASVSRQISEAGRNIIIRRLKVSRTAETGDLFPDNWNDTRRIPTRVPFCYIVHDSSRTVQIQS